MKANITIYLLSILVQCSNVLASDQACTEAEIEGVTHTKEAVLSKACKTLPNDDSKRIISVIYDTGKTNNQLPIYNWTVALENNKTRLIHSSYTEEIIVDSAINVYPSSIWIDTANYTLANGLRAFGVRLNIESGPNCADFYQGDQLTLFTTKGNKTTPILKKLPMKFAHYIKNPTCASHDNSKEEITERAKSSITILKTKQHGLNDIKITTKSFLIKSINNNEDEIIDSRIFTKTIYFNGVEYEFGGLEENPSKEWWVHKK